MFQIFDLGNTPLQGFSKSLIWLESTALRILICKIILAYYGVSAHFSPIAHLSHYISQLTFINRLMKKMLPIVVTDETCSRKSSETVVQSIGISKLCEILRLRS